MSDEAVFDEDTLLDSPPDDAPSSAPVAPAGDAAPGTPPKEGAAVETEPGTVAGAATPAPKPEPESTVALDKDTLSLLSDARLRPVPGETKDQALLRLTEHYRGRATSHWSEVKQIREETRALREMLDPLIRNYHHQLRTQQLEDAASRIPDKEADPEGYRMWLSEEILRRDTARRRSEQETAETNARLSQESAEITATLDTDETVLDTLESAFSSDPEAESAYRLMTQAGLRQIELRYPDATHDQHVELLQLAQMLDMRQMSAAGVSIPEALKAAAAHMRSLLAEVGATTTGNGQEPAPSPAPIAQPAAAPVPAPSPALAGTGSATAARLARDSAAASARAAVAPPPPASGSPQGNGGPIDISAMDEDSYVEFALANPQDVIDDIIRRSYGQERRR